MLSERRSQTFYRRLAKALMLVLSIPHGDELVMVFGTGEEQSNLEAIANWVASMENEVDLEEASTRLEALARKAMNRLEGVMV